MILTIQKIEISVSFSNICRSTVGSHITLEISITTHIKKSQKIGEHRQTRPLKNVIQKFGPHSALNNIQ